MTDEEVKQWFLDADREYEEKKKAGYHKNYVPAGGHTPDFSSFIRAHSRPQRTTGMENSMYAPKPPKPGQSSKEVAPFHRDIYRSMAAYNAMLKTKKEQPEVPLQPHTLKESNFPTLEPFNCNAYRSMDSYNAMLKTKKERSCPCAW
ncbi:hypothetical protein B0H65DRAFT_564716 [Neurospora tetraspora]|uniref:Uncharacterized protein n=1 Tax=Neurospora tetraspora TaxID=94610 RepID=A0AAE0JQD6_9PEZI|nr:hypothetical protein B0H65DRAFT_564716 [Neurospora tetraspora]